MKNIAAELPAEHFIQFHRNTLVHTQHIRCLTSRLNGDYDLHLLTGEAEQDLRPCPKKTPIHGSKSTLSHV
jgi:DNA-binding LytR/AlgR family response regulator